MAACGCGLSAVRRARPRSSEEHNRCDCGSKAHGADSKSQSKGLPCWAPLDFLTLNFLALHFLVEPFDIGKRPVDAVSGAGHLARPPATGARVSRIHSVCSVSTSGTVNGRSVGSGHETSPTPYQRAALFK